jgi:hypothetical protein
LVQYFFFTKNKSLNFSNWYCWSCRAFGDAQDRVTKGKKKAKSRTKEQNKSRCKTVVFYGPFLPIWYCINLSFCYLDAVCSAATGVLFLWIPCDILLTVKFRQPSHEFTFGVGMTFVSYPLVLTPMV